MHRPQSRRTPLCPGALVLVIGLSGLACPTPGSGGPTSVGPRGSDPSADPTARPAQTRDEQLLELARSRKWQVRRDALKQLASSKHRLVIATLVAALDDIHPQVRSTAESILGKRGQAAAPALARYYTTALGKGRARAALLLNLLGVKALPALARTFKTATATGRKRLVQLVSRIPETGAVRLLLEALDDGSHRVRETAGEALIRRTDEDEITLMLGVLDRGRPQQRQHLLEIFGVLRDARIVDRLMAGFASEKTTLQRHNRLDCLLRHPSGYDRAVAALAAKSPRLRKAMLRALDYELSSLSRVRNRTWVRAERKRFITAYKHGRAKVRPVLRAALKSTDTATALAAARVLRFFGALRSIRTQRHAFMASLRRRLRNLSPRTHADRRVVVYARLGFMHWAQSCTRPDAASLCMRTVRKPRPGRPHELSRTFLPRKKAQVAKARKQFHAAWKAWAGGAAARRVPVKDPARARRIGRCRHYAAWARFMSAEMALESFLKRARLRMVKPAATADRLRSARKQLAAWYKQWSAEAKRIATIYREARTKVVAGKGKHRRGSIYWRLASLARVGALYQELAYQINRIKTPRWIQGREDRTAFAEAYLTVVDRLEKRAKRAFRACLQTAAEKRYFWDVALHCEAEYMTLDPEAYDTWSSTRRARLTRIPPPKVLKRALTTVEIRHVVRSRRGRVQACFTKHLLKERPNAKGSILVKFRIETNGRVKVQSVRGLRAPRTQACIRKIYAKIRFPVGPLQPTDASYSYHYKPGLTRISF